MSDAPRNISHYRIERRLGSGGMGAVYLATDRRDQGPVAVKLLHAHLSADPSFRERFEHEAHIAALLRSPYTVHVLEHGVVRGQCFIAMEYVHGQTLKEALASGPLPPSRAVHIALQVARALEEADARGVVHRDVKPENILLRGEDSVKVTDFGIARHTGTPAATSPGALVGTLAYAAPEQLHGLADHRSDIYALGATLYHMLAGRPPFGGDLPEMLKSLREVPPPAEPLVSLRAELRAVVLRCLEKDPTYRYQSASDVANDLTLLERDGHGRSTDGATLVRAESPNRSAVSLQFARRRTRVPFVGRLRAVAYDLTVRNDGDEVVDLQLVAEDDEARCRFEIPERVSVLPHATSKAVVRAQPRKRRWRGARETHVFTVYGSVSGGGPPAAVAGQYGDEPYGWLPVGAGASILGIGAAALIALSINGAFDRNDKRTEPLTIAVIAPFTGQSLGGGPSGEDASQALLDGARIAVSEINADGGVLGQPITLVQGDSAGDAEVGAGEARRLVRDGAQVIIGDLDPFNVLVIANQVSEPNRVVQFAPVYISDEITTDRRGAALENDPSFLFKLAFSPNAEQGAIAALIRDGGYESACVISDQLSSSSDQISSSEDLAAGAAGDVRSTLLAAVTRLAPATRIVSVRHDTSLVNGGLAPTEAEIAASAVQHATDELAQCAGASVLVIDVYLADIEGGEPVQPSIGGVELLHQAVDKGFLKILLPSTTVEQPIAMKLFDAVGWDRTSAIVGTRPGRLTGEYDTFELQFLERFRELPASLKDAFWARRASRAAYDAVYLTALAAEQASSTDPDRIRGSLATVANAPGTNVEPGRSGQPTRAGRFKRASRLLAAGQDIDYDGAGGPIEFDDERENTRAAIETWRVDTQARTFITDTASIFDLKSGEALPRPHEFATEVISDRAFVVPVTLTLGSAFEVVRDDERVDLALGRLSSQAGPGADLRFAAPIGVIVPDGTVPLPADLASWIANLQGVDVLRPPTPATIGGRAATRLDVKGTANTVFLDMGELRGTASGEHLRFGLSTGEEMRLIIVDVDAHTIVIAAGASLGDAGVAPPLEEVLPDIEAMLATVKFE